MESTKPNIEMNNKVYLCLEMETAKTLFRIGMHYYDRCIKTKEEVMNIDNSDIDQFESTLSKTEKMLWELFDEMHKEGGLRRFSSVN